MFSLGHLIWIGISLIVISVFFRISLNRRPPIRKVFKSAFIAGTISEIVKFFSVSEIVPMVDAAIVEQNGSLSIAYLPSGEYTPYLPSEHLPLELCSLYLFFLLIGLLLKDEKWKKYLYATMFASGTLGGLMGIILSSIAGDFSSVGEYFASFRVWQFFLYHAMIVTVSLYIGYSGESGLSFHDWKKAALCLVMLDVPTFYLNSVLSSEVYVNNKIVGVTHRINFFSSYVNPLGLILTQKWQWILYIIIKDILATALVLLLYMALRLGRNRART